MCLFGRRLAICSRCSSYPAFGIRRLSESGANALSVVRKYGARALRDRFGEVDLPAPLFEEAPLRSALRIAPAS